ncbi:4Fe-4S dicluster domain-containing protein [Thioalbus denitrificans]|uniref:Fe-S-cluster-containing dehydrogenase component n=1 Tax=Thioalbus denitrificans TaxID=547122 RepID=A0A369CGG2_9GAMM|nr:4Fe-4S dicluster domain-containing protein [Thioalbus denitrificans]RCX32165.1 Fe-S-cluster-containing dehydrogenase component [Thioalbus denitrificans]
MTRYAMVIDLNTCVGCNACMAACAMENQTPVWKDRWRTYVHDKEIGTAEEVHRRFFPRLCNHCDNPPCLTVCPTGATYQLDNGIVLVDDELCMGCRACAMACPYDARYEVTFADIERGRDFYGSLERERPSMDKCTFCAHRVEQGLEPACVQTCVGSARMFGDLHDPEDPVARLVASGVARPLLSHLGTRPNVYYIGDLKRRG